MYGVAGLQYLQSVYLFSLLGGEEDMKKYYVVLFFLLLTLPNLLGTLVKSEEVNRENRRLASAPQLSWENLLEFPAEVEAYLNDHAPFRSHIMDAYAVFNMRLFHSVEHSDVILGKEDWMFYKGNGSVTDMLGVDCFSERQLAGLLESLLKLRSLTVEDPEDFVLYIAPNKEIIYRQYVPDAYAPVTDTSKAKDLIRYIREHSDIKVVYPEEALKEAAKENLTYYRYDTHWNQYGGFLGAQELLKALGVKPVLTEKWSVCQAENGGWRDLIKLVHFPEGFMQEHDVVVKGYLEDVAATVVVEDEDEDGSGLTETISPRAAQEKQLVMVRDSFGKAMMSTMWKNYQKCRFIHAGHLKGKSAETYQGDVFVFEIVERQLGSMPFMLDDILVSLESTKCRQKTAKMETVSGTMPVSGSIPLAARNFSLAIDLCGIGGKERLYDAQ